MIKVKTTDSRISIVVNGVSVANPVPERDSNGEIVRSKLLGIGKGPQPAENPFREIPGVRIETFEKFALVVVNV
jgi:hypothetical protein